MKNDEFLACVRERGEYRSQEEAEEVATAVLEVLGSRITAGEAEDLAAQMPPPLDDPLLRHQEESRPTFGVQEFCEQVGERTGGRPGTAEWDASAVLSTLADSVSGGELNQLISQLPTGYAALFGKPELSD